jgi:Predicted phosphohydrolases
MGLYSCATSGPDSFRWPEAAKGGARATSYPGASFMVLSDTHLYDASLGTSGAAWDAYMAEDRKLLADSEETLKSAVARIEEAKPGFLIVTGDLTKDGERQCHQLFAKYLGELESAGIKCFVLPGNHDVNNPAARRFLASGGTQPIPNVSPDEFAAIYKGEGYGDALYRDPASLSYVAQPLPGLWLLMLDSAKYEKNAGMKWSETSGAIREPTYRWIEERLKEARDKGVAVIAAEHHPLMEHFAGMKDKYPEYVLDDNWRLASLLASYGVRLFFSGHYHASSIVMHRWDEKASGGLAGAYLVDVETGSLVTWPCSYRRVSLSRDGRVAISTSRIDQLPSYAAKGASFDLEGKKIIEDGISNIAKDTMKKYKVPAKDIDRITPRIVDAMMAHYAGDACFQGGGQIVPKEGLGPMGRLVISSYDTFLRGIWKTIPPANVGLMEDNDLVIEASGAWAATTK